MRRPTPIRPRAEPTIALINVVFLLLVFFLIAGQLSPPLDRTIRLAQVADLTPTQAPDALVIAADGTLIYQGAPTGAEQFWATQQARHMAQRSDQSAPKLRIVPDRDLPAATLLSVSQKLRALGADELWVVTERGLKTGG